MYRFNRQGRLRLLAFALIGAGASFTWATEHEDSQTLTATVDEMLRVTAPVGAAATHPGTDADMEFSPDPLDPWAIESNASGGATVNFVAGQPFTHATDATYKRDVQLSLSLASSDSGSGWSVSTASASTDYAAATPVTTATVTAASTAAGDATFDLTVTLKTGSFSTMAVGDYTTTITGTLTAN